MGGIGTAGLAVGISLAVIVLSLARIIAGVIVDRSLSRQFKRFQTEREERRRESEIAKERFAERVRVDGEAAIERIQAGAEATIAAIRKNGEETRERIRADGEAARRRITEGP